MKTIRIGNDVAITWAIVRNGKPEDFRAKALSLFMYSRYGKESVKSFAVNGNSLRFAFLGKSQRYAGDYGLLLVVNEGADGMFSVDLDRAFCLTEHTDCGCTGVISLSSDIAVPANGLSAYELAVINGYKGTEQEWLQSLVQPAKDAAAEAFKAAGAANDAAKSAIDTDNAIKKAETGRVAAEQGRVSAETGRTDAESKRVVVESSRVTAETGRVKAEQGRESAEVSRVKTEQGRASAEEGRADAELKRVIAESSRVAAEDSRVSVEQGRVLAESTRVTAENQRQTDTANAITAVKSETSSAVSAMNANASAVLTKVQTDTQAAIDANNNATTDAVNKATAATTAANDAAIKATTAADNANAEVAKIPALIGGKQDVLVSGQNIKTINGQAVLGAGNIDLGIDETTASTIASTRYDVDGLITDMAGGNDYRSLPLLCGQPIILFGHGAPAKGTVPDNWRQHDPVTGDGYDWNGQPSALGQQYLNVDVTPGGLYIAVRDTKYNDLKWLNI